MYHKRSKNPTRAKIQRLRDKADALWSQYIRTRDNKCLMCGTKENLQAHHCIVTKGASSYTRWHLDNGISLCYKCHIHGIHGEENIDFYRIYVDKLDQLINYSTQEQIIRESKLIYKMNVENLESKVEYLKEALNNLHNEIERYDPLRIGG